MDGSGATIGERIAPRHRPASILARARSTPAESLSATHRLLVRRRCVHRDGPLKSHSVEINSRENPGRDGVRRRGEMPPAGDAAQLG